jgi:hypothetical protein
MIMHKWTERLILPALIGLFVSPIASFLQIYIDPETYKSHVSELNFDSFLAGAFFYIPVTAVIFPLIYSLSNGRERPIIFIIVAPIVVSALLVVLRAIFPDQLEVLSSLFFDSEGSILVFVVLESCALLFLMLTQWLVVRTPA